MAMKKIDWNQEFPEVPHVVHHSVLDTLSELEETQEVQKMKRTPKKRILLLAAVLTALAGTTAAATGLFQWNERAEEVFGADEEAQNMLTMEQMAEDVSSSVTDQGITITSIQTVQDKNRFYALFEVTAEDADMKITPDQSMAYTMDFGDEEDSLFSALGWHFVDEDSQEVSNTRYFEIYGTKMKDAPEVATMNIQFTALESEPEEKAGVGSPLVEGTWDFTLNIHEAKSLHYDLQKEYQLAGYAVNVESVELSPLSVTIVFDGEDIRTMEAGEGVNLDHLDCLPAIYPTGVCYSDGTNLTEPCFPMTEGYTSEERTAYQVTLQFTKVVDAEQVTALLMGEDKITF